MRLSEKIEAKRKAKEKALKKEKAKTVAVGATVEVLTGTIGGILLAPKSGKETRDDLKAASSQLTEKVNERTIKAKSNVNKTLLENKEKLSESKRKVKEYLKNKKSNEMEIEHEIALLECNNDVEEKIESIDSNSTLRIEE
ncbi:YtxH domain-containing protein [Romboutsia lituseburensis]|uniref:YtxH domain-containing protein n=1 Tax=Romboutsia lituseburensis TaxID=1537 RepID=UPI00215ABDAC|nr:YtxH domain-containing protein [Romboutsia lituseburensis]MCR8743957.1 YtxH domain-containing protein [Romboutsia lituseburensis]